MQTGGNGNYVTYGNIENQNDSITFNLTYKNKVNKDDTLYYWIVVNTSLNALNGHYFDINGLTNPAQITFNEPVEKTNLQSNIFGIQTILSTQLTISTLPLAANIILDTSKNNLIYSVKIDQNSNMNLVLNNIKFILKGTLGNSEIYNPSPTP